MTPATFLLLLTAVAVAAGRFAVPGHGLSWAGSYEAVAHIWVGAMLVIAVGHWREAEGKVAAGLLAALTVLETVMFLTRVAS